MFFEQALKVFSIIIVGIYIARYLGPYEFGLLSYAIAIASIFMAISRLGMESVLIRNLVSQTTISSDSYLGTSFTLMFASAVISATVMYGFLYVFEANDKLITYILIISMGLLAQPFMVIDYNFQSQIQAKYSAISKSVALLVGAVLKLVLVYINADLLWIVLAYAGEHILVAVLLMRVHIVRKQPSFLFKYNAKVAKELMISAWPLLLSALTIILYMRVDQIMIKSLLGVEHLGLYSAVARIYEGWLMIAVILSASLLPAIIKSKNQSQEIYEKRLTYLFALVFWLCILVSVFVSIIGNDLIILTFGSEYSASALTFTIIMWSSSFAALGSVSNRYLVAEKMEKKIALRTFIALMINIVLNFILIPRYGIEGAAIATLVCLIVANYLVDYFDKELVQLLRMKNNAIKLKFNVSVNR